jgi:hypothetical protein
MLSIIKFENEYKQSVNDSVHRIFCIDVSGSMSGDLPKIRRQLKNKMPTSIRQQDFMSLIWFSGRGQFGTIFEHMSINDLKDLANINQTIDRYIISVGSTGFVEPIRMAKKLTETYNEQPQVFFLTDGGENVWSQQECLQAFKEMENIPLVIVEYQYYCDRVFLEKLADISNGVCIFNENFESYDVSFDNYMINNVSKSRIIESGLPILYMNGETFVAKLPTAESMGLFRIPEHVDQVWNVDISKSFVFESEERMKNDPLVKEVYLTMLFALQSRQIDVMEKCVNVLGDIYLSKQFSVCFSKQDESRLYEHILYCIKDPETYAFKEGVDVHFIVKNDVFTVIDLLQILQQDVKTRYYPYHPSIVYNRISKEVRDDKIQFIPNRDVGSSFGLVYHQSRANISASCVVHGHEKDESENIRAVTTFRNYTIIKDGIKNMDMIAVSFSEETFQKLKETNLFVLPQTYEKRVYLLDLKNLPVVNRLFMKVVFTSDDFCNHHIDLLYQKSQLKYVKKMIENKKKEDKEEEKKEEFKKDESKKEDNEIVRDFYIARELQVKVGKCSTIPAVNEKLITKLDGPESKLTLSEWLLLDIHKEYKSIENDQMTWLFSKQEELKKLIHDNTTFLEKAKMAILIGGCWFSNCLENDKTFLVTFKNQTFNVTVEINDTTVYMS